MKYAQFERFEFAMSADTARMCSHQGACDADVADALMLPDIKEELARVYESVGEAGVAAELKGYGAWDDEELADVAQNEARLIWLAAGAIVDELNA